jgi:hypothetical protein
MLTNEEYFRNHYEPCAAWVERLAMRQRDLSPSDRAALFAHVQQCRACAAVQAEYQFLDAQLRAWADSRGFQIDG